jgi:two-component system phosphate regulon sensor histidine kinase PhoR
MILIKVKDNGLGMSKVAQEFWEVLQRTHRRFTQREGHGLGLAYVKRIVEDHNGHVESEKGREVPS